SELGVTSFEATPNADSMELTIRATDEQGMVGRREVKLVCGMVDSDFILRTDRAVYTGGDTMQFTVLGGGDEPNFVDLLKDGQTLVTEAIPMAKGRGEQRIDLPPELFGTLELSAYRLSAKGVPIRKTRLLYVYPANQLKIATTLDRPEYRPGGQASVQFILTDKNGNPTPGALSLAAVDEAVFAVLEQTTRTEQAFFTVTPELAASVKELSVEAKPGMLEQASFAGTANTFVTNRRWSRYWDDQF